jgi:quinoprotein glucose dehydrogenase
VVSDVVVTGASLADSRPDQPPGDVRGFDARSGRLLWTFHVVAHAGEPGSETWQRGSLAEGVGANPWAPLAADLERGLVFVPTSSASPDLYGGRRPGANLFADSLLVLRARTGERVWHFQTVHHDLWDYDLGSPPNLVRLRREGRGVDAVAQLTKTGFVFVFDRETGAPLFPIEERAVPQSDVPGEESWPTQPFPLQPPPLVPQRMTEADLWDRDPQEHARCREALRASRNEGIFTPPSERGSVFYPSPAGGANWSGGAFDPESGLLYVPSLNFALLTRVDPLPGEARAPAPGPHEQLLRRLAPFRSASSLPPARRSWMDQSFFTCLAPPWGLLVAVDLNRGEIRWRVPVGEDATGVRGLFHMGHALVTAGGLVFHAGSEELRLRAHDAATGELVASFELPAGLHAGPMTYKLGPGHRQFLVVAPGGHYGVGRVNRATTLGDWVIAYALPD